MEKEFVTYEIALKLKELGFDEPCFGYYTESRLLHLGGRLGSIDDVTINKKYVDDICQNDNTCLAPLWQQVIDWLREEHDVIIDVAKIFNGTDSCHFAINLEWEYFSGTYYEAREESILKAIELIK